VNLYGRTWNFTIASSQSFRECCGPAYLILARPAHLIDIPEHLLRFAVQA